MLIYGGFEYFDKRYKMKIRRLINDVIFKLFIQEFIEVFITLPPPFISVKFHFIEPLCVGQNMMFVFILETVVVVLI